MEIRKYFEDLKCTQRKLLEFIESEENIEIGYQIIINFLEESKIQEDRYTLKLFLHLLSKIINNHNRKQHFFDKIEKLLLFFKTKIKQSYSNHEIYNIFKGNKRIILFLIKEGLLIIDEFIASTFLSFHFHYLKYPEFFHKELKPFSDKDFNNDIPDFEEKRNVGENEWFVCSLIRNDMIQEFVEYVNRINLLLKTKIQISIFETNKYLLSHDYSLIEYAAFFGAVQIFQYLKLNSVELDSSLWLFAIHGNSAELIYLLEEEKVNPIHDNYVNCFKEAIKCHHNDIARYIQDNYNVKNDDKIINFKFEVISHYFRYHNYEFIPEDIDYQTLFYYACYYDYYNLVKLLLNSQKVDVNELIYFYIPALNFAAKKNNQDIINLLLSQENIKICPYCFDYCAKLTEINLPDTLIELEKFSFRHCSSLSKITIPASVKSIGVGSFSSCKKLQQVTILGPITSIQESTFNECSSLELIIIPSTVTRIDRNAFDACTNLKEITIPNSVKFIGSYAFWECKSLVKINIPSSIIKICSGAFRSCHSLAQIEIPSTLKSINDCLFWKCNSLEKIEIPSSVKTIGEYAFYSCKTLREIKIPSSVTKIYQEAFCACDALEIIEIPESVTEIGRACFSICESLTKIRIPSAITSIYDHMFYHCQSLAEINLPSSVTSIEEYAFEFCKSLIEINIPSSVTSIGNFAFYECTSLSQITFESPSSLNSIGEKAFKECSSLKHISIPSTVTSIGIDAFEPYTTLDKM